MALKSQICFCSFFQIGKAWGGSNSKPQKGIHFAFLASWQLDTWPTHKPCKAHFTHETENPWPQHFKHSHWWKRRSRSKFATSHYYAWGTNGVCKWMQDGCEVYVDFYVASNGLCFMVTWITFKNHLLEVGLTQNLTEIKACLKCRMVDFFYSPLTR